MSDVLAFPATLVHGSLPASFGVLKVKVKDVGRLSQSLLYDPIK